MELARIMSLLNASGFIPPVRYYKYVMDSKTTHCATCLRFAGEIFADNDRNLPILPRHPNCDCYYVEVNEDEYFKQKKFKFGLMTHDKWSKQSDEEKYLWCNTFRNRFGYSIDKYAKKYNIPKQLLAGVIANEMLEWDWLDGTRLDGIKGGGVGYAQISIKTAQKHGVTGTETEIRNMLNSYEGSVSVAAKILKNYLDEFRESIKKDKLGQGFIKSGLYSVRKTAILEKDNIVDMNVPQWLLNSMCAVWNSEIKVIYAKDKMGNDNYPNAYWHGMNSCVISGYLPKLVNE